MLVAAALLKDAYDRRALAVILLVLVLPEADTLAGPFLDGAHRALLHNLAIPFAVGLFLAYDTRLRTTSWLRNRFGPWGIRVAWVTLFVHLFAHLFLDWSHLEGINLVYPLVDRFFHLDGELAVSTADGLVQTFVEIQFGEEETAVDAGAGGTTENTHVDNPVEPTDDPDEDTPVIVPFTWNGWQLHLVVLGLFTLVARRLQGPEPDEEP